ncbi:malto-oligosyltrehalose synthase [Bordetella sp. BOR01]|uniref:malto-oligosyltrehalose synthase n=1 Tax=Bordetella sp. BOR01 TaxID=2854779 RepID=UPI001C45B6A4|nr:malto-oligosyltrehalose synthase [Bordetella sp. BOR01]MBV7486131.1 malto-oligosyltrehalose synthase [Bordetella sp. BOR01]
MTPRATARLQLHGTFTLDDVASQVPYYAQLGISHLYLSPVTQARPGSTHGYDVVDHGQLSAELGGEPALRRLVTALRSHEMGLIIDIVPNHMAADYANPWWRDVLAQGPDSRYADWFDIDWKPADPALHGKVLLPQLSQQYGTSLRTGEIQLAYDAGAHEFVIDAAGARLPLAAGTQPTQRSPGNPRDSHDPDTEAGRTRLHQLLEQQHYRLAWWRTAADQINWRRFFEISGLTGMRVEQPEVFDAIHALVLRLYAEGLVDGVRVDHVDGLADPIDYCRRLRTALRDSGDARLLAGLPRDPYLVVEKILGPGEALDERWEIDGTTGYDFMDQAGALLHDPAAASVLTQAWQVLVNDARPVREQLEAARLRMLTRHFAAERRALVQALLRVARSEPDTRDWSEDAIDRVLTRWLAAFPVYRTYAGPHGRNAADQACCQAAATRARQLPGTALSHADNELLDQVNRWLAGDAQHPAQRLALRRFQQLTPPVAAKALEDTLFYRYGPLLSRNEVGASPEQFALSVAEFHRACAARARRFPAAMLATATHDHKRGEDVRARLAVLTEIPLEWLRQVQQWLGAPGTPPAATDRYMLLQTLVGAWPLDLQPGDTDGVAAFLARVQTWQGKALREAKQHSNWTEPDLDYEAAGKTYLDKLQQAGDDGHPPALARIAGFAQRIAPAGLVNSLAQTTLRLTVPGVPDLYQGTEFWDFSLVDPDNRQPVDYAARAAALSQAGHAKQQLIQRLLHLRAAHPLLFDHGSYLPLSVHGAQAAHVVAFARCHDDQHALVVVPHLCAMRLSGQQNAEQAAAFWADTRIRLPAGLCRQAWRNTQTHQSLRTDTRDCLALAQLLQDAPVSVWMA